MSLHPRAVPPRSPVTPAQDCLTERHFVLFGRIIHAFARHETLLHEILAMISGADATAIKLLTARLKFADKHAALFDLLRHREVAQTQIDQIRRFFEPLRTHLPLRDDIAHSRWIEEQPATLLSPAWLTPGPLTAIRPVHDIGNDGKAFAEEYRESQAYTLDTLSDTADRLEANYAELTAYLATVDLSPLPDRQI